MTDYDVPLADPADPVEPELYPCAHLIAQLTHWVMESTRYGYENVRRWDCILRYFKLMSGHPVLFTHYANIRVTVITKISEIQEYIMEDSDFVVENRSLFTLLYYVMNDVLSLISHVEPPLAVRGNVRGDVRRKRKHGGGTDCGGTDGRFAPCAPTPPSSGEDTYSLL